MFGHHDDKQDDNNEQPAEVHQDQPVTETHNEIVHPADETVAVPDTPAEEPAVVAAESASDSEVPQPPAADTPQADGPQDTDTFDAGATDEPSSDDQPWQHPGAPIDDGQPASDDTPSDAPTDDTSAEPAAEPINDVIYPAGLPKPPTMRPGGDPSAPLADESQPDDEPAAEPASHELIDIKVKALDELAPLIDDLDMAPEDKFRTIMMMIQASDNQELVAKAYEIAHSIEDEKTRAQALLDVVNEINYFTQPHLDEA